MEYKNDFLVDFQPIKQKFKNYYLIFGCHCLTILAVFFFSFNSLWLFFQPQFLRDAYFLYRFFLFFIYPLIGLFFFSTNKKIGWFIIAHYSLSLLVISLLICISNLVSNQEERSMSALQYLLFAIVFFTTLITVLFLYRDRVLSNFHLTRTAIFICVITTIIFPIIHAIIFF